MTRRKPKGPAGQGLHLRLINGETVRLHRHEVLRVMLHRYLLAIYLVIGALLVVSDPSGHTLPRPVGIRVAQYLLGEAVVILGLLLAFVAAEHASADKGRAASVPLTPLLLAAAVLGLGASEWVAVTMLGAQTINAKIFAVLAVFYFVVIEVAVQLVVWLLLPHILADLRGTPIASVPNGAAAPVSVPPGSNLAAGGYSIAPETVLHIEAQGNYVAIFTDTQRYEVPGPFAGVIDQMPPALGLRTHRSHWVARRAVTGFHRKGRDMVLDLVQGRQAPVALPRQQDVTDWIAAPITNADQPRQANAATRS